jgi:hypothetical protein
MNRRDMLQTVGVMAVLPMNVQLQVAPLIVTTDIVGTIRPQGRAYDIGAYEYIGAQSIAPSRPSNTKIIK